MGSEDPGGCACLHCHWRVSVLKKVLGQDGHESFMPKWAQHTWQHVAAQEVEGPPGQPSTQ